MREIKDTIMELEALKNRKDEHEIKVDGAKEALSHAIKCCEIVEGLPSVEEIEKVIMTTSYRPGNMGYTLAQAIHDRIKG